MEEGNIYQQLKKAREQRKLSQRQLSSMTGLQQTQLSRIENGSVDARLASITSIARALGLEIVLVPRNSLSVVGAVLGETKPTSKPAYQLGDEEDENV